MKLVRKKKNSQNESLNKSIEVTNPEIPNAIVQETSHWQVLIVDDEPDVHIMTRLSLKNFTFAGKSLQLLQAKSGLEAQEILTNEPAIAVALIDVVMETDDAGLRLVEFIRTQLKNFLIRLIIRTGQPGMAPEKEVIERYDIDDYKDKTELTAQKLYTTMRMALKSYRDLNTINTNRQALRRILDAAPNLYRPQSLNQFFDSVLSQIISLCNLGKDGFSLDYCNGLILTLDRQQGEIQAGTGRFADLTNHQESDNIVEFCLKHVREPQQLPPHLLLLPLEVHQQVIGFIYLEDTQHLTKADIDLIHVMVNQCASALQNLRLYLDLEEANQQANYMLSLAEQARNMAEAASRAKTTFLAKMSHELRTPLNAILGYSNMIQEEAEEFGCEDLVPDLDKVQLAGKQLLDIISNILDVSKIEADKLELNLTEFSIAKLIEEVVTTIKPLVKIEGNILEIVCPGDLGTMTADYHKVRQILLNLLNNASKFTKHGKITLSVTQKNYPKNKDEKNEQSETDTIAQNNPDLSWLLFQVTDTGIGIAQEQLNLIFEAFIQADNSTTREYGGTGLGLTICENFCRVMGGDISVCSIEGEGSTFTVKLPKLMVNGEL
jgi:signal transduction histidine kinase/response regulator of citrate/malate metabolism